MRSSSHEITIGSVSRVMLSISPSVFTIISERSQPATRRSPGMDSMLTLGEELTATVSCFILLFLFVQKAHGFFSGDVPGIEFLANVTPLVIGNFDRFFLP